jgi:hypothetical protein
MVYGILILDLINEPIKIILSSINTANSDSNDRSGVVNVIFLSPI